MLPRKPRFFWAKESLGKSQTRFPEACHPAMSLCERSLLTLPIPSHTTGITTHWTLLRTILLQGRIPSSMSLALTHRRHAHSHSSHCLALMNVRDQGRRKFLLSAEFAYKQLSTINTGISINIKTWNTCNTHVMCQQKGLLYKHYALSRPQLETRTPPNCPHIQ